MTTNSTATGTHLTSSRINRLLRPLRTKCAAISQPNTPLYVTAPSAPVTYTSSAVASQTRSSGQRRSPTEGVYGNGNENGQGGRRNGGGGGDMAAGTGAGAYDGGPGPLTVLAPVRPTSIHRRMDRAGAANFELARKVHAVLDAFRNVLQVACGPPPSSLSPPPVPALASTALSSSASAARIGGCIGQRCEVGAGNVGGRVPSLAALCAGVAGVHVPLSRAEMGEEREGSSSKDGEEGSETDSEDNGEPQVGEDEFIEFVEALFDAVPPHYRRYMVASHALTATLALCVPNFSLLSLLLDACLPYGTELLPDSMRLLRIVLSRSVAPVFPASSSASPSGPPALAHHAHAKFLIELHYVWKRANPSNPYSFCSAGKHESRGGQAEVFTTEAFASAVADALIEAGNAEAWTCKATRKFARSLLHEQAQHHPQQPPSHLPAFATLTLGLAQFLAVSLRAGNGQSHGQSLKDLADLHLQLANWLSRIFDALVHAHQEDTSASSASALHPVITLLDFLRHSGLVRRSRVQHRPQALVEKAVADAAACVAAFVLLCCDGNVQKADEGRVGAAILRECRFSTSTFASLLGWLVEPFSISPALSDGSRTPSSTPFDFDSSIPTPADKFMHSLNALAGLFRARALPDAEAALWGCALRLLEGGLAPKLTPTSLGDVAVRVELKKSILDKLDAAERVVERTAETETSKEKPTAGGRGKKRKFVPALITTTNLLPYPTTPMGPPPAKRRRTPRLGSMEPPSPTAATPALFATPLWPTPLARLPSSSSPVAAYEYTPTRVGHTQHHSQEYNIGDGVSLLHAPAFGQAVAEEDDSDWPMEEEDDVERDGDYVQPSPGRARTTTRRRRGRRRRGDESSEGDSVDEGGHVESEGEDELLMPLPTRVIARRNGATGQLVSYREADDDEEDQSDDFVLYSPPKARARRRRRTHTSAYEEEEDKSDDSMVSSSPKARTLRSQKQAKKQNVVKTRPKRRWSSRASSSTLGQDDPDPQDEDETEDFVYYSQPKSRTRFKVTPTHAQDHAPPKPKGIPRPMLRLPPHARRSSANFQSLLADAQVGRIDLRHARGAGGPSSQSSISSGRRSPSSSTYEEPPEADEEDVNAEDEDYEDQSDESEAERPAKRALRPRTSAPARYAGLTSESEPDFGRGGEDESGRQASPELVVVSVDGRKPGRPATRSGNAKARHSLAVITDARPRAQFNAKVQSRKPLSLGVGTRGGRRRNFEEASSDDLDLIGLRSSPGP